MSTTQQQPREGAERAHQDVPVSDFELTDRDVRRKRPPVLSFLLRLDPARRIVRVGTLLTLDFFGVYMAIITALWLKAGLTVGEWRVTAQSEATAELFDFAYLVTVLL